MSVSIINKISMEKFLLDMLNFPLVTSHECVMDYICDNNITNLLEWYNILLSNHFKLNCAYGKIQINRVFDEGLEINDMIYEINYIDNMNNEFKCSYHCNTNSVNIGSRNEIKGTIVKLFHISEEVSHPNFIVLVILKKLSNYKLTEGINYYFCNIEIIKSVLDETLNEFKNTQMIGLINKYDIETININVIKCSLFNTINHLISKTTNNHCKKCEKKSNIKISDINSSHKMLSKCEYCNSNQITDAIPSNYQIEITI